MENADEDWLPGDDSDPTAPPLPDGGLPTPPVRWPLSLLAAVGLGAAATWASLSPAPPLPAWLVAGAALAWLAFAVVGRSRAQDANHDGLEVPLRGLRSILVSRMPTRPAVSAAAIPGRRFFL